MWTKLAAASALLLIHGAQAQDCAYTVSVLDVEGVQCVTSAPCSGTYYASGLSQGVGACPSGTACALLPETPIMGCAAAGRTDLIYVNADGTLTKDGRSVTLSGASSTTSDTTTTAPTTSSTSSTTSSTASSTTSSSTSSTASSTTSSLTGSSTSSSTASNAGSGSGTTSSSSDGGSEASSNSTVSSSSNSASNTNSSTSNSWNSESGSGNYTISPGSSSANQQAEFNPGSILSDDSKSSNGQSGGGLGLGSIIAIVVGCLAVVAIAAGARLLKKGKEAEAGGELETPAGALEDYNNGGGGSGMTPKENVLLL